MNEVIRDECALTPWLKRGDNFLLGSFHFVCMGYQHGRIRAMRHDRYGFYMHSLSIDLALRPDFRIVERQKAKE